jgi:hypothetical protein
MPLQPSAKSKVGPAQRRKLSFAAISLDYESFRSGDGHRSRTASILRDALSVGKGRALLRMSIEFQHVRPHGEEARVARRLEPWQQVRTCGHPSRRPRFARAPQDEAEVCFWGQFGWEMSCPNLTAAASARNAPGSRTGLRSAGPNAGRPRPGPSCADSWWRAQRARRLRRSSCSAA